MKHILVTIPVEDRHKDYLENIGQGCQFQYTSPLAATQEQLEQAEIMIGNVSPEKLKNAKRLEWLQLNSAGADNYCKDGVLKEGVLLTNATGAYGLAISEYMVGMSFLLQNKL